MASPLRKLSHRSGSAFIAATVSDVYKASICIGFLMCHMCPTQSYPECMRVVYGRLLCLHGVLHPTIGLALARVISSRFAGP